MDPIIRFENVHFTYPEGEREILCGIDLEIAEGRFRKEYAALVHGRPEPPEGTMEDWLFKDRSNKTFVVRRERKGVKKAILTYRTESTFDTEKYGALSLVSVLLQTGRTHQIRVQFASRRLPLLGDGKYGARDNAPFLGLACQSLAFRHPGTGEETAFAWEPGFAGMIKEQ